MAENRSPEQQPVASSSAQAQDEDSEMECSFVPPDQVATTLLGNATWCLISERRLISICGMYKPFGVRKHFHLAALTFAMHNIVEDEENTDFEEFLFPDDYKLYMERRQKRDLANVLVFSPRYRFRPTPEQIMDKLGEFFDTELLEHYDMPTSTISEQEPVEFDSEYAK